MKQYKNRKLSALFLGLFFIVSCAISQQTSNFSSIAKITNESVYFIDGKKMKLPYVKAKNTTVVYLVRHAEKEATEGRDPLLTKEGMERADRLQLLLKAVDVDAIYSTNYQRTQLTAAPTAKSKQLEIESYDPRALDAFATQLKKEGKGQKILVVGHSNTTPTLTNALIGQTQFTKLDESEYGHLFMVVIKEDGTTKGFDLNF